jgi:hypothetical protein
VQGAERPDDSRTGREGGPNVVLESGAKLDVIVEEYNRLKVRKGRQFFKDRVVGLEDRGLLTTFGDDRR